MVTKKIILSSIAAATIASSVYANNTELDSIDVWDTEIISSSLDIDGTAIETKQADHLSDLLSNLPGVDIGGTHSINNRLNIRGLQDEDLDITIDGAKIQNANMFHHIGNLLINPDILKRVEIEVGTNSVVNGSLGGSVSFETKDAEDLLDKGKKYGARVQVNYNSNDSKSASVAGYGKVSENAGFMIYHNQIKKGNWENGKGEEKLAVEGDIANTLIKYGHKIGDTQKIIISYDKVKDEGDYSPRPDFGNEYNLARTGTATYPTKYTRDTISLKHELRLDETIVDSTIYNNENELKRHEYIDGTTRVRPGYTDADLVGSVKTAGLNIKAQSNISTGKILNTFTYGGFYDKQTSTVDINSEKYGTDEEAITKVMFIEDAMDFDNGLVLIPGIRYNMYDFDGSYGKIEDKEPTYSLATEYAATDSLTLLASATTLYKGVQMVDVLDASRASAEDTPSLKPETGINKEIGFRYIENSTLGADKVGVSFKYFRTDIKDYIETNWDNYPTLEIENVGEVNLKGFEASFVYNKDNLNTLLSYSRSDSEYKQTGAPLKKDPGDSISLAIDYKLQANLAISWESLFLREETDVYDSDYNKKDAYSVHDIAVNYKPVSVKNLTLIAGIDNIFDKEYYSHISENRTLSIRGESGTYNSADLEPGRNVKVSLAYKF